MRTCWIATTALRSRDDGDHAAPRVTMLAKAGVPVIAITENAMAGDDQRCLAVGMNDDVARPIDRARLLSTVACWGHGGAGRSSPFTGSR